MGETPPGSAGDGGQEDEGRISGTSVKGTSGSLRGSEPWDHPSRHSASDPAQTSQVTWLAAAFNYRPAGVNMSFTAGPI